MNNQNEYANNTYPMSFNQFSEPRTMPAGWDLSGIMEAQEKIQRARQARRVLRLNAQKQIPLNPVESHNEHAEAWDYRRDAFSGPSSYPSRWNLE